ncbi:GNAT family N-acetyltransferase [Orrella daihaiensis]|uniref:N-acetyltransferase n=1 Tax=Orrella daihaiensis TaxID=2782176 RepID=A0ABY4APV9_9BURK|nr:GNAT family N-acetyltransferase [Orrella daihaiensis]UOD51100.1 N-acetyltransferase [Orrella daihaiensis]
MPETLLVRSLDDITQIDAHAWDALNAQAGGSILTSHRFLSAFEQSASVCPDTGWQAQHLIVENEVGQGHANSVLAIVPLYLKAHSYGEFVFDWAWADAYERAGLRYYPKWLAGVPFTPVTSARLLCESEHKALAAQALIKAAKATNLSSLHVLYTNAIDQRSLAAAGCLSRHHTQFHWHNQGWQSFDEFLSHLTQPKRKKIRAERRKVRDAGVTTAVKTGHEISDADWDFFYRCYANTYAQRGNPPYLTRDFFELVDPKTCLLILAYREKEPVAASLLLLDNITDPATQKTTRKLYGRYWGGLQAIDCLHFEVAYYAPIEWAIANGIDVIEGGAQGEHKMARGFMPVQTQSAHWLAHEGFAQAVENYLEREKRGLAAYNESLGSAFKAPLDSK